jgi:hypothetical protein
MFSTHRVTPHGVIPPEGADAGRPKLGVSSVGHAHGEESYRRSTQDPHHKRASPSRGQVVDTNDKWYICHPLRKYWPTSPRVIAFWGSNRCDSPKSRTRRGGDH